MKFTLTTADALAFLSLIPESTRCFGTFAESSNDRSRYLGTCSDVVTTFQHEAQETLPGWNHHGLTYCMMSISFEPCDDVHWGCGSGDDYCVLIRFGECDENPRLPDSWSLPITAVFAPNIFSLFPKPSLVEVLKKRYQKVPPEKGQCIEEAYYAGAHWVNGECQQVLD